MSKSIAIGSFEGSNNIRQYNKGIINVDQSSSSTELDATRAFARTVDFTSDDIGFTTSTGGGGTSFDSPITSDKSGVNVNVSECQDQRSTNTDGDPTMLNGIPRAGNSAVDVIPTMTNTVRGIAKVGPGLKILDDKLFIDRSYSPPTFDANLDEIDTSVSKYQYIQVDGDKDTFYPVRIEPNWDQPNSRVAELSIYRWLGEKCAAYDGNHSNGTSASTFCMRFRCNGWDGAGSIRTTSWISENYARLFGKVQLNTSNAGGVVVWLRGGGTVYHIWSDSAFKFSGPWYSRTDIGHDPYPVILEPLALSNIWSTDDLCRGQGDPTGVGVLIGEVARFSGTITASKVYNAVWNDYAELFERGCDTEPGDLIALDTTSSDEKYILANEHTFNKVVGVHSDEYGHLIGGENPKDGSDFLQYNLPRFIPVGLCGRVRTKVVGTCKKGDYLVASNIDGVARKYKTGVDDPLLVFGMACEDKNNSEIERIKVYLK